MGIEDIPELQFKVRELSDNNPIDFESYTSLFIQISHKQTSRHFIYAVNNTHSHESLLGYFRRGLKRFYDTDSEEMENFEVIGRGWLNFSNDGKVIYFYDKSNGYVKFDKGLVKAITKRFRVKFN